MLLLNFLKVTLTLQLSLKQVLFWRLLYDAKEQFQQINKLQVVGSTHFDQFEVYPVSQSGLPRRFDFS